MDFLVGQLNNVIATFLADCGLLISMIAVIVLHSGMLYLPID